MITNNFKMSPLQKWLLERQMTTGEFVELIGCSGPVIWKVKRGLPISPKYARRIKEITGGAVDPSVMVVGKPRKLQTS